MSRKVVDYMNRIFEILEYAISKEDGDRIAAVNRHIKASGNESIVIDFVKQAGLKRIPINSFGGCLFKYKDEKFLLISQIYSAAIQEIGFDEIVVSEDNSENAIEIIQGCEMLAISEGILGIKKQCSSLSIIDGCLGINTGENVEFLFSDVREFFEPCAIYRVDDSRFNLLYDEDIIRLCSYCICDRCSFITLAAKNAIKQIALLLSSRSIAPSIINGLRSPLKEYTFLQLYQCLEYLFRLNNSFSLCEDFSIGAIEAINIVSTYDFKLTECENLRRVLVHYSSEKDIEEYLNTIDETFSKDESRESKCDSIAKSIYQIRCQIAHLRYGQDTFLETVKWDPHIEAISNLVLAIYEKCDTNVTHICEAKSVWKNTTYLINDGIVV